jgi:hypothetical protein
MLIRQGIVDRVIRYKSYCCFPSSALIIEVGISWAIEASAIINEYEGVQVLTTIKVVHPVYKERTPSCRATSRISRMGFVLVTEPCCISWTLVLEYSNGYYESQRAIRKIEGAHYSDCHGCLHTTSHASSNQRNPLWSDMLWKELELEYVCQ